MRPTPQRMLQRFFIVDGRLRPVLRVLVYIVAALSAQAVLAVVVALGYQLAYGPDAMFIRTPAWLDELVAAIAVVGVAIVLRIYLDRRSVESLGITFRTRWLQLFALGAGLGAGMQLLIFALGILLGTNHVLSLALTAAVWRNVLLWCGIFAIAALAEEMPLRGYILQNLWEEWGFWPAAIVTSALFALLHVHNPYFGELPWQTAVNIAVDGMWACCSILWTRSLWVAWGGHFAWNVFEGPVLGTPVSGIHTGPDIVMQYSTGSTLLTGGGFGPESSLLVPVVEGVGIIALYAMYRLGWFSRLPDTREAYAAK